MREIKFRAWDTVDKVMKLPTLLRLSRNLPFTDDNNNGKVFQMQCNGQENIEYYNGRIVLMQYTGLRDKNGKEIYEGDILHVLEISNTRDLEYKSPVEFIDSGFLVTQPDECQVPLAVFHNLDTSYPLFEIEVIGNIYENADPTK